MPEDVFENSLPDEGAWYKLEDDVRIFFKVGSNSHALVRSEYFLQAGDEVMLGDPVEFYYDHNKKVFCPVLSHGEDNGDETSVPYVNQSEIPHDWVISPAD